jgi:hypothetical protein
VSKIRGPCFALRVRLRRDSPWRTPQRRPRGPPSSQAGRAEYLRWSRCRDNTARVQGTSQETEHSRQETEGGKPEAGDRRKARWRSLTTGDTDFADETPSVIAHPCHPRLRRGRRTIRGSSPLTRIRSDRSFGGPGAPSSPPSSPSTFSCLRSLRRAASRCDAPAIIHSSILTHSACSHPRLLSSHAGTCSACKRAGAICRIDHRSPTSVGGRAPAFHSRATGRRAILVR